MATTATTATMATTATTHTTATTATTATTRATVTIRATRTYRHHALRTFHGVIHELLTQLAVRVAAELSVVSHVTKTSLVVKETRAHAG